ncbi:MAG: glycosyltransferase [Marinosulfonomonas sp.]
MIFVSVGTQLPFNRLIKAMDTWSAETDSCERVVAQVGALGPNDYRPKNIQWTEKMTPEVFSQHVEAARLVISHAGMGSIITALSSGKQIIIMPRHADLGEHRNDHQMTTVAKLRTRSGIYAVDGETDLPGTLNDLLTAEKNLMTEPLPRFAEKKLVDALRNFIFEGATPKM